MENAHTAGLFTLLQDHGPTIYHLCKPGQVASPPCALAAVATGKAKGTYCTAVPTSGLSTSAALATC